MTHGKNRADVGKQQFSESGAAAVYAYMRIVESRTEVAFLYRQLGRNVLIATDLPAALVHPGLWVAVANHGRKYLYFDGGQFREGPWQMPWLVPGAGDQHGFTVLFTVRMLIVTADQVCICARVCVCV